MRTLSTRQSLHYVASCVAQCTVLRCPALFCIARVYMQVDPKQEEHGSSICCVWQQHLRPSQVAVWALGPILAAADLQQGWDVLTLTRHLTTYLLWTCQLTVCPAFVSAASIMDRDVHVLWFAVIMLHSTEINSSASSITATMCLSCSASCIILSLLYGSKATTKFPHQLCLEWGKEDECQGEGLSH